MKGPEIVNQGKAMDPHALKAQDNPVSISSIVALVGRDLDWVGIIAKVNIDLQREEEDRISLSFSHSAV